MQAVIAKKKEWKSTDVFGVGEPTPNLWEYHMDSQENKSPNKSAQSSH